MSEPLVLDAVEQRVLGSLLEKQLTVPGSYPLSLSALVIACNQATNREPVLHLDPETVEATARGLKSRGLVRVVWGTSGQRTLRYHQRFEEVLEIDAAERAVLTVLLLRGPQTVGELRARSERLHRFPGWADVEAVLARLAGRGSALVQELPRRPGRHETRWAHLLGGPPADAAGPATPPADRERVLADGGPARDARVRDTYDRLAAAYADALTDELAHLPFERWLLERVSVLAAGRPVVEVGCGPGHVTAFLAQSGAQASGVDLSPAMIEQARQRYPQGTYEVGELARLGRPPAAPGWGAVLAWYSVIHLAPSELPEALASLVRRLDEDGWLVVALHAGEGVRSAGTWFGESTDLQVVQYQPAETAALLTAAGLDDVQWYRRGPLEARGESTERLYLLGRRAGPSPA